MLPLSSGLILLMNIGLVYSVDTNSSPTPVFEDKIVNVTVEAGSTATLPCSVLNLRSHQLVWSDQYATLLTHQDKRVIDDDRLSIERPYDRDWNLHIRDVRPSDQGLFNCQINTDPVMIKTVNLIVQVPAKIVDHASSRNMTVKEHGKAELTCNATGVPPPTISWYRVMRTEKGDIKSKIGDDGAMLAIHNVTRYCGGRYLCVAFNDVGSAASRLMEVSVKFAPEVILPNSRIGQKLGMDTILECEVTAFPMSDVWWMKDGQKIDSQHKKYRVDIYDEQHAGLILSLRIFTLEPSDYGVYTCVATNSLGSDRGDMVLYDFHRGRRTTTTTTTTTTATSIVKRPWYGSATGAERRYDTNQPQQWSNTNGNKKTGHRGYDRHEQNQHQRYPYPGDKLNHASANGVYTQPHAHSNNGNGRTAQAIDGGNGSCCFVKPNCALMTLMVLISWNLLVRLVGDIRVTVT